MDNQNITVVYRWNAKPGKLDELVGIYHHVVQAMKENEPGATAVHLYVSEADQALFVRDEFQDAGALGFHLQQTAAAHFGSLLEIAEPGPFSFFGNVPPELQAATAQMQLDATFAPHATGFDR